MSNMAKAGDRVSEYVLEQRIGAGAFGEVWRAHHHVWADQRVAVKLPHDTAYLRDLQREGLAVQGLEHPNIVKAIGFDPYANPPYLTIEYVPGHSLRELIQHGPLAVNETLAILRQVLAGLEYAHSRSIIHRDLKPENVLIHESALADGYTRQGVVKITDFGLGQRSAPQAGSIAYSMSIDSADAQRIVGTLDYMSPEQRSGGEVDARTDLYACGVMLFEMLTGEKPSGAELPSELRGGLSGELDEIFRKSFSRRERRYDSAAAMLAAVTAAGKGDRSNRALATQLMPQPLLPSVLKAGASNRSPRPKLGGGASKAATVDHPGLCRRCQRPVSPDDQFCMHCGVQMVTIVRRCGYCGAYPAANDEFCTHCGKSLAKLRLAT